MIRSRNYLTLLISVLCISGDCFAMYREHELDKRIVPPLRPGDCPKLLTSDDTIINELIGHLAISFGENRLASHVSNETLEFFFTLAKRLHADPIAIAVVFKFEWFSERNDLIRLLGKIDDFIRDFEVKLDPPTFLNLIRGKDNKELQRLLFEATRQALGTYRSLYFVDSFGNPHWQADTPQSVLYDLQRFKDL